jgi:nephrocystin-3
VDKLWQEQIEFMTESPKNSEVSVFGNAREIRVFVSSTFCDMQRERELLVKHVFPELRRICVQRFVTFTEVDLRWGISEEQSAEGKVLPICLEEIHRSRPYFIGLLGERYGWIPESMPPSVLTKEPWLRKHISHRTSITELEILHGVLNNPKLAEHAYFYFRDSKYVANLPESERLEMIEHDLTEEVVAFGKAEAMKRTEERKAKLIALKQRIRQSGFPLVDGYSNPEDLAEEVRVNLLTMIDCLYPESTTPGPIDQEALGHDNYAMRKRLAFVPRSAHTAVLNAFVSAKSTGQGLVVTGESGSGKTTLLADWVHHWREENQDDFVFVHYFGSTPNSALVDHFLHRLLGEIKIRFGLSDEIPAQSDRLRMMFPLLLAQTVGKTRIVIVLDALNHIEGNELDRRLTWLPSQFPPHVRVLSSTLPGPALDTLSERNWTAHELPLAGIVERGMMIDKFFRLYRKNLSDKMRVQLINAPGSANPLFLRTVLEELRQFGSLEQLPNKITEYLTATTPGELFGLIIRRWQQDFDDGCNLVERALSLLWAARQGLSEIEWRELLSTSDEPLLRQQWSPLFLAIESHLVLYNGLYAFGHEFLRHAVEKQLLATESDERTAFIMLADYFEHQQTCVRKAIELPWQLSQVGDWGRLLKCVTDIPTFLINFHARGNFSDWYQYCAAIEKKYDLEQAFVSALSCFVDSKPACAELADNMHFLGLFLAGAVSLEMAFPILERANAIREHLNEIDDILPERLSSIGCTYLEHEVYWRMAEPFLRRALKLNENLFGHRHPKTGQSLNNLAGFFICKKDFNTAAEFLRRALTISETCYGRYHADTARILNNLALVSFHMNLHDEAEKLFREAIQIREQILERTHPELSMSLENLGIFLLEKGKKFESTTLLLRAESIYKEVFGPWHTYTRRVKRQLEQILYRGSSK